MTPILVPPRHVTETRHIIGLVSYYRKFIANFSDIVKPLTEPTKKNMTFNWVPLCQQSLDTIKVALTISPILIFPDTNEPYVLFTDASKHSWSGILNQEYIKTMKDRNIKTFYLSHMLWNICRFPEKLGNFDKGSLCYLHDIYETFILPL